MNPKHELVASHTIITNNTTLLIKSTRSAESRLGLWNVFEDLYHSIRLGLARFSHIATYNSEFMNSFHICNGRKRKIFRKANIACNDRVNLTNHSTSSYLVPSIFDCRDSDDDPVNERA